MTEAGELFATIGGKDVGLSAILQKIEAEMQHGGDSAVRLGQQYARLAQAQGQPALASQVLAGTLQRAGGASERAILGIETQAARLATGSSAFQEFGKSAASSLTSMVGPAALATSAIGATLGVVQSFGAAFKFKAELDQTTTAIGVQLRGVRDSGQAFAEAGAFAAKYKLTQQEVTGALQASVGVLRNSKSSVEDVLSTLSRLQLASPEQSLSDAALALKELQGGSINSLVQRFEVSRATANQMKKEIEGGADAVQVLGAYLDTAGISMDSLKTRTQGAAGALNDAKIAAEQLKLAQANIAQSAGGVAIVQEQARVYQGLANVLNGQFIPGLKASANELVASIAAHAAHNQALAAGKSEAEASAIGEQAYVISLQGGAVTLGLAKSAVDEHSRAVDGNSKVVQFSSVALSEETQKKLESQVASAQLAQEQAQLEADSLRAAQGLLGAGDQALILAQKYGIAAAQAQFLIAQQQALANKAALAEQRAGERNPGSSGIAEAAAEDDRRLKVLYRTLADPPKVKTPRAGGGPKLSDQQKLNNSLLADQDKYEQQSEDLATQHANDVEKIYETYYAQMKQAQQQFDQDSLEGRAGFYDNLGSIESAKIRQSASAQYEAAAQEAGQIAAEKGADVADKYMSAQEQVISARAKRLAEIEKASKEKDAGKAEYLKGVDEAYRKAEDAKLARIKEGDGSLASERDKQLGEAADKDAAAQDKLATAAERAADRKIAAADRAGKKIDEEAARTAALATTYDKIAAAGAPTTTATTAAPGATPAAAPAAGAPADPLAAAIDGAREAIVAALAAIERAQRDTTGAVRNLKAGGGVAG